jgi:hypothetical protein
MHSSRRLTFGPSNEPLWAKLYIRQIGEKWAGMIVAENETPPLPDQLKGLALFGDTPGEAEQQALDYLGMGVARN